MEFIKKEILLGLIHNIDLKRNFVARSFSGVEQFVAIEDLIKANRRLQAKKSLDTDATSFQLAEPGSHVALYRVLWCFVNDPPVAANYNLERATLNVESNPAFEALHQILGQLVDGYSPHACAVVGQFIALNSELVHQRLPLIVDETVLMEQRLAKLLGEEISVSEMVDSASERSLSGLLEKSIEITQRFLGDRPLTKKNVSQCMQVLNFVWEHIFKEEDEAALLSNFSAKISDREQFLQALGDGSLLESIKAHNQPVASSAATQRDRFFESEPLVRGGKKDFPIAHPEAGQDQNSEDDEETNKPSN